MKTGRRGWLFGMVPSVAEVVVAVWLYEGLAYTLYQLEAGKTLQAKAECGCGC